MISNIPFRRPVRSWGGPGSGQPCALCTESIGAASSELELEFSDGAIAVDTMRVHADCYAKWERDAGFGSDACPASKTGLSRKSVDGILSGRERGEQPPTSTT